MNCSRMERGMWGTYRWWSGVGSSTSTQRFFEREREDEKRSGGEGYMLGPSLTAVSKYNVSTSNTASIYRLTDV